MNPHATRFMDLDHPVLAELIATLHDAGEQLEELTHGEIDTVADGEGHVFVLRHAQEELRDLEDSRRTAVLNALPANIAVIDAQGSIVAVNEAWRLFGDANGLASAQAGVGLNYLDSCDGAVGEDSSEAVDVAAGIRRVLNGQQASFSIEYPCHSPTQQRWFLLKAIPVADDHGKGAVVMHLDITRRVTIAAAMERQNAELRALFDVMPALVWFKDTRNNILRINKLAADASGMAVGDIEGRSAQEIYPETAARFFEDDLQVIASRAPKLGIVEQLLGADGEVSWTQTDKVPYFDPQGEVAGIVVMAQDITERKAASETRERSEKRLRDIFDGVAPSMFVGLLTPEGVLVEINQSPLVAAGLKAEDVIGRPYADTYWWTVSPQVQQQLREAIVLAAAGVPSRYDVQNRGRGDDLIDIDFSLQPLRDESGKVVFLVPSASVITERKLVETRLHRMNRIYAVLSEFNALLVRVSTREELYAGACRIAVEAGFLFAWLGMCDGRTRTIVPVASFGSAIDHVDRMAVHLDEDAASIPARAVRDGTVIVVNNMRQNAYAAEREQALALGFKSMIALPLKVEDECVGLLALYAGDVGYFNPDETELLSELAGNIDFALDHFGKGERLNYLAYFDDLTGLANQALFLERLQAKLMSERLEHPLHAVFVVDIQRFKSIDDALGRTAGDALLKLVAQRMVLHGGGDATRFSRIGADRFAIVASDLDSVDHVGRYVEQRLDATFGRSFKVGEQELRVSVRVGIALFPGDGTDAATLLRNAEAAAKKAKAGGDRYLFFTPAMTERVAERLSLENRLRDALDREEFVLHYQPKLRVDSAELSGCEALIRWNDPHTGKLVQPMQFIPVLEETGLIREVGRWALRRAVADYMSWRRAGLPAVRIAVNVSPLQLRNRAFVAEVEDALRVDAFAAAGLELEITESLVMEDVKHSIEILQAIRDMSVTIAIDDFGTGFSSLSYLAKLPVDTLKIDRSFVNELQSGAQAVALVSTIITLAHSLKLKVVAEGVETQEQSQLLRGLRCDEMQGYLFSRPIPADVFAEKFLAAEGTHRP